MFSETNPIGVFRVTVRERELEYNTLLLYKIGTTKRRRRSAPLLRTVHPQLRRRFLARKGAIENKYFFLFLSEHYYY